MVVLLDVERRGVIGELHRGAGVVLLGGDLSVAFEEFAEYNYECRSDSVGDLIRLPLRRSVW
jgi:hypothetical protein